MNRKIYVSDHVKQVRLLHREIINQTTSKTTVKRQLRMLSDNLFSEFVKGNPAVTVEISNWHPELVGKDADSIMNAEFSNADARETIARGYGFTDWKEVEDRADDKFDMLFEHAVDTLLNGNIDLLKKKIKAHEDLLSARSKYGHGATLLHYISSNGVEIRRQKVPMNIVEIAKFLIESGADKEAKARVYGGEFTPFELASTSAHPKDAGLANELNQVLS